MQLGLFVIYITNYLLRSMALVRVKCANPSMPIVLKTT